MDIHLLAESVREDILTKGHILPTIHMETTGGIHHLVLSIINDHQSIPVQCGTLAWFAWEYCKKYPDETPVSVSFTSEGWQSHTNCERPVSDRKRREVLIVDQWQAVQEPEHQALVMSVLRDHKKRITQILSPMTSQAAVTYQLAAFVRGVRDAQQPGALVFDRLDRSLKERVMGLSSEKMQALSDFINREGLPPDIIDF